jgi:phosphatidate cytidylyltransferase
MLRTRVITAIGLFLVLFAVLVYGGNPGWLAFVTLVLLAALWEWAGLCKTSPMVSCVYAVLGTVCYAFLMTAFELWKMAFPMMALGAVFWVAYAPWCLKKVALKPFDQRALFLLLGWVLIAAACVALLLAKSAGLVFLVSTLAICWVADIFAYFVGKALGRNKLAPRISPGKSWEGAIGGAVCVLALSWVVVLLAKQEPMLKETWQHMAYRTWHPVVFSFWLLVLSAFSVVGDLFESMLKRAVGLKDSSQLLPGHGGVLDRIDAQLPVLPLALLLVGKQIF